MTSARTLRVNYNIPSGKRLRWLIQAREDWVQKEFRVLAVLLNADPLELVDAQPSGAAACPTEIGVIFFPWKAWWTPRRSESGWKVR